MDCFDAVNEEVNSLRPISTFVPVVRGGRTAKQLADLRSRTEAEISHPDSRGPEGFRDRTAIEAWHRIIPGRALNEFWADYLPGLTKTVKNVLPARKLKG